MTKKHLSILIAILVLVVSVYFGKNQKSQPVIVFDKSIKTEFDKPIKVAQVIDGDTIILINGDHVRYIGIDTPEEFDPRKPVQCFAHEAAAKNKELVEGKMIKFNHDVNEFDQYGRYLGFIYLEDGTFINEQLVRQGYAFAYPYPPDVSKSEVFRAAETYARENKLGLWSGCTVNTLKGGREQTNPVN